MMYRAVQRALGRLCRPTFAIPLDIFRILAGLLAFAYFAHLYAQVNDYSSPDGLIDHALTGELFWYTRVGLFQPWMGAGAFRAIYLLAALGSLAIAAGYRVRLIAFALYLVAVSAYRWNFLVIYVDDSIMHLCLFWLILLPTGQTLTVGGWLREGRLAIPKWKRTMVPGGTMRCFLLNLALVDLVAGLWKLTSPMWRDGTALYAVLRMPIAYLPGFWQRDYLPLFRAASYGALALELLLPAVFVLALRPSVKWLFAAGALAFHFGILATLMIPYANLACVSALVLVFRSEIMAALTNSAERRPEHPDVTGPAGWPDLIAIGFLFMLTLAMIGEIGVPYWRFPTRTTPPITAAARASGSGRFRDGRVGFLRSEHNVLYAPLWFVGMAQSYRLFDWVDDRNFGVSYHIVEHRPGGATAIVNPEELFPHSLRGVLLESYLLDVTWGRIPSPRAAEFKQDLFQRFAQRFCRSHFRTGTIEVGATVDRLTATGDTRNPEERIMVFGCHAGRALVSLPRLPR